MAKTIGETLSCKQCSNDFIRKGYYHYFCSSNCKQQWRWHNVTGHTEKEVKRRYSKHQTERLNSVAYRIYLYKRNSKKSGRVFNLTKEQFESVYGNPCYYCGRKLQVMGLDRVDNGVGYEIGNVVSCCTDCNIGKRKLTQREFIGICNLVAKKHPTK